MLKKYVLLSIAYFTLIGSGKALEATNLDLLKDALSRVDLIALKNLRVTGETTVNEYDPQEKRYSHLVNKIAFTETIDLIHPEKVRLDFHPITTQWEGSKSGFFEYYKSYSFNGQFALVSVHKQGEPEHLYERNETEIFHDLDDRVAPYKTWTIREFTLGLLRLENSDIRFSEAISKPSFTLKSRSSLFQPSVSVEKNGEKELIRVDFKSTNAFYKEILWLSQEQSFLLVRREKHYQTFQKDGDFVSIFNVIDSQKVKNVWLPTHVTIERISKGTPVQFVEMKIESITADFPETEETFNASIKPGAHIEDRRDGTSFTAGNSPKAVIDQITNKKP